MNEFAQVVFPLFGNRDEISQSEVARVDSRQSRIYRQDKLSDRVWSYFGSCSVCFGGLFITRDMISCWRI